MNDEPLRRDAELLYEVGTLRHIARTWVQFGGEPLANVAEHTLRVAWIGIILAAHEGADAGRVAQLALVHDLSEGRTGDAHYLASMYVERNERGAVRDSVAATALEDGVADLWREWEEGVTLEARIVSDADSLDVDLELMEWAARGHLPSTWNGIRKSIDRQLHTPTAQRLVAAIRATDPHDWHMRGRNRATAGDWRPNAS